MRFLFISTLYPSSVQPTRATYSRSLLLAMRELGHEVRVIAPVAWCPIIDSVIRHRELPPAHEELDAIRIDHPRFLNIPGVMTWKNHLSYRRAVMPVLKRVIREWQPDHVSIGFAYPDGAAIVPVLNSVLAIDEEEFAHETHETSRKMRIAHGKHGTPRKIDAPTNDQQLTTNNLQPRRVCATDQQPTTNNQQPTTSLQVLGSDFRLRIEQPRFRGMVMDTLRKAPLVFCPGQALKRDMAAAGIAAEKIVPFNNGVNRDVFHPGIGIAHGTHGRTRKIVLFVGNLVPVKGVDRLLKAFRVMRTSCLQGDGTLEACPALRIIGSGTEEKSLRKLAHELGIADSVQFLGRKSQNEVADSMRQSHCLCLPSRSEGMPNVVLEALACGTPVVATAVGENPYLIKNGVNGQLVAHEIHESSRKFEEQLVNELGQCLVDALSVLWTPSEVARTVDGMTWVSAAKVFVS